MNEEEELQKALEEENKRAKEEYDEVTKGNQVIRKKQQEDQQLKIPGLFESADQPRSGVRRGASLAFEIGANTLVDPLSVFDPTGTSQYAAGSLINYIAQKIRGGEISAGEMAAAGLASLIPGGAQGTALVKFGKGALKGAASGAIEATSVAAIDEGRLPTAGEFAASTGFGAAFGGALSTPQAQKAFKEVAKKIDDVNYDLTGALLRTGLRKTNPLVAQGAGAIPPPRQSGTFDNNELNSYVQRAFAYRKSRQASGSKINLMKGFDETINNKSNQPHILVKKSKKVVSDDAAIENYDLRKVADVELEAAARLGFDYQVGSQNKYLKTIVAELNKNPEIAQNPKLYLSTLMEYGDRAYLEHKVARRMAIPFWQRVEARRAEDIQNNLFQWTGATNRNDEKNIRLLLDPNYKTLKDTTEKRLDTILETNNLKTDDAEAFVITIEDPNDAVFSANSLFVRSNPGNIQIRKAGTGEVVGAIPDFYRQIYSTQFKKAFGKTKALQSPDVPQQIRALPGETIDDYRKRIINTMLDNAVFGRTTMLGFEERYLQELNDFYSTFEQLQEETGLEWVRKPSWVQEIQTGKNNFADATEADIREFNIRDQQGNVIQMDVDTEAELRNLKELEDLLRNLPREQSGRLKGNILTSKRGFAKEIRKEIDAIRKKYNLGKYRFKQQELNI